MRELKNFGNSNEAEAESVNAQKTNKTKLFFMVESLWTDVSGEFDLRALRLVESAHWKRE